MVPNRTDKTPQLSCHHCFFWPFLLFIIYLNFYQDNTFCHFPFQQGPKEKVKQSYF